ncbi:MAG: FG-GAP-like repeat-containing protein [Actinomycetota bacterium]
MNRSTICKSAVGFAQCAHHKSFFCLIGRPLRATLKAFAGLMVWSIFIFSGQSFAQNSLLDPSFDGDGKVFTQFLPTNNVATNAVLQPDGKIIVVGSGSVGPTSPQTKQAAIIRYNPNGSLDTTFDSDGKVTVVISSSSTSEIKAAALQPDGKLVAVGIVGSGFPVSGFIMRLNPDGSLDPTFDGDGKLIVNFSSSTEPSDMALQPDGKILLAGRSGSNTPGFLIARFNPDGSLDTGFGTNSGYTLTTFSSGSSFFNKIALLADGKIAMTGKSQQYLTVRYTANGLLDLTFGNGGIVNIYGGNAILQQPDDGKLVIVNNSQFDFAANLWRLNYDGTLDSTFGSGGFRQIYFTGERVELEPDYDVALDTDGKIVVGGSIRFKTTPDHLAVAPDREFVVRRLNRDGSDDLYFGFRGFVATEMSGIDSGTGLLIQPDGKIVLAGDSAAGFSVARYIPGTANHPCRPVGDFNGDGKSDLAYVTGNANWNYRSSLNGSLISTSIGNGSDTIVPGDYNGDCYADYAIYRSDGSWDIRSSADDTNSYQYQLGGQAGDIPVPADYDGDDWADPAVYRNGTWLIKQTRAGDLTVQFGISGDIPVPADYDGDGKDDAAVYRPSNGTWYLLQSRLGVGIVRFGLAEDKPVVGDYDGDGKSDIALYRPSEGIWYLLQSTLGFGAVRWGIATDKPVPADYDGDGRTDIAVYRNGDWYLLQSTSGYQLRNFGGAADRPIQNAYIP